MTRVYISGPITGIPSLNIPRFDEEEYSLRAEGYEVFNPHSIAWPSEITLAEWRALGIYDKELWLYFMRICIGQIPLCDEMRMLPHWQNSKGAVREHRIAEWLEMPISYCHVPDNIPKW